MTEVFTGQPGLTTTQLGALLSAFQARLARSSATAIILSPYKGASVGVNGEVVVVPDAGFSRVQSDNRIDSTGADAGAALAINTLYYVYVSNSKATFSPLAIRCSTVAPTAVAGVKYLGATGNALNWRFVGWVYTISNAGTPNFADSTTQRLVANYYNRERKEIGFICPGYVDDNAVTTQVIVAGAQTNWAAVNLAVGEKTELISNGEDAVEWDMYVNGSTDTTDAGFGVAVDGLNPTKDAFLTSAAEQVLPLHDKVSLAEGYHTLDMVYATIAATNVVITWDGPRYGAAADPKRSGYSALVMV